MSLYRDILRRAWQATWHHKHLWLFGLFAALLINSGELNLISRALSSESGSNFVDSCRYYSRSGIFGGNFWSGLASSWQTAPSIVLVMIFSAIVLLAIFCLGLWLAVVSQVALVGASAEIVSDKKSKNNNLPDNLAKSREYFWPVLGLNLLSRLAIMILALITSLTIAQVIFDSSSLFVTFVYVVAVVVVMLVALSLSFIIKYAIAYLIIRKVSLENALRDAWKLYWSNWLVSLELAVILFAVTFGVTIAVLLAIMVIAMPFMFLAVIFSFPFSAVGFVLILVLGLLVMIALTALTGAALTTFVTSAWTGLFMRLIGQGGKSKIIRVIEGLRK